MFECDDSARTPRGSFDGHYLSQSDTGSAGSRLNATVNGLSVEGIGYLLIERDDIINEPGVCRFVPAIANAADA